MRGSKILVPVLCVALGIGGTLAVQEVTDGSPAPVNNAPASKATAAALKGTQAATNCRKMPSSVVQEVQLRFTQYCVQTVYRTTQTGSKKPIVEIMNTANGKWSEIDSEPNNVEKLQFTMKRDKGVWLASYTAAPGSEIVGLCYIQKPGKDCFANYAPSLLPIIDFTTAGGRQQYVYLGPDALNTARHK